jgi:hypothetical protein
MTDSKTPAPKSKPRRRATETSDNFGDFFDFAALSQALAQQVSREQGGIPGLIDIILRAESGQEAPRAKGKGAGKNAKHKRMSEEDVLMYANLLEQALEELRYEVDRDRKDAIAQMESLRQYLLEAGQRPGVEPDLFLLVLQQFTIAKLDIGDELRGLAEQILGNLGLEAPADDAASALEVANEFKEVAKALGGDPFAIHGEIFDFTQSLTPDVRAMFAATLLTLKDAPGLRDAALGWMLDEAAEVREAVAQILEKDAGNTSGATLRRMIALRNWVPEGNRPALDRAIKASRKKVACASWPSAKVVEVRASGFDGSGAQSVFVIAAEGRKRTFAALLFKHGFGVRDAWTDRGGSKAEVDAKLKATAMQIEMAPASLDYVAIALRHFLGVNVQSGVMPPFGLLDAAEAIGLTNVIPEHEPVDALLSSLFAEIAPERATPQAIEKALETSASWAKTQPMAWSWFEESDDVDALLAKGRLSKAKRMAALLAMPMQKRRRWWAEMIAWTGCMMKHTNNASGWEDYVLVGRELLGDRPLDEFGIMNTIAEATVANVRR